MHPTTKLGALSKGDQKWFFFFIFLHISHHSYYRVRHLPVEDFIDSLLPPQMEREISGSRLQLVLLSPTLLQVLARNSNTSVMGRFLHPDRVIAIMLGKYLIVNFTGEKMLNFQFHEFFFRCPRCPNLTRTSHLLGILRTMDSFRGQRPWPRICTNGFIFFHANSAKEQ